MKLKLLAAAVAFALAGAAHAQSNSAATRDMKKAEHERIEAEYKADKVKCDGMQGNMKDVCMKEAKGKEDVAKAELDAKDDPSARNQQKVAEAKAKAKYEVDKEKCDDMKGKEKAACQHQAKADYDQAKAAIKPASSSRGASAPDNTARKP